MGPRPPVLALVTVLALPAAALAASPTRGGRYDGVTSGTAQVTKRLVVKVAPNGATATAQLYCGTGRGPTGVPRFKITHGRFTAARHQGTILIFSLKGRFTTRTSATVLLHSGVFCDGKSATIKVKLVPKG